MPILALVILLTLLLAAIAWAFFLWTVKSGQYDDPEGAKYRMMEDEPPAATATAEPSARAESFDSAPAAGGRSAQDRLRAPERDPGGAGGAGTRTRADPDRDPAR